MATTATLHPDLQRFPPGTTVKAYKRSNFAPASGPVTGAPQGTQDASATVSSAGVVSFTGLTDNTEYVLYASVSGQDRYARFLTKDTAPVGSLTGGVYSGAQDFSGATVTLPSGIVIPAGSVDGAAIAAAIKDPAAGTAGLRTLGTGAAQAAAGNHGHAQADITGLVAALAAKGTQTDLAALLALPKRLVRWEGILSNGNTVASSPYTGTPINGWVTGGNGNSVSGLIYFDPADYAIAGYTTKLSVVGHAHLYASSQAAGVSISLRAVTSVASSGNTTIGAAQVTKILSAAAAASGVYPGRSSWITAPAAGLYCLCLELDTATSTGAINVSAALDLQHV